MIKVGIGLPAKTIAEVKETAQAAQGFHYDSFSIYGDIGDLPPYSALHACADVLRDSKANFIGPMGISVGMQNSEIIAGHAIALEEQLPNQSYIGLVRGAFLEQIGEKPASLAHMLQTINYLRTKFSQSGLDIPICAGGFGPRLLNIAGELALSSVKLGGSVNPFLAEIARHDIDNDKVRVVMGAVSVIDRDRQAARQQARLEVAKYLAAVGKLDTTLNGDEQESLRRFFRRFAARDRDACLEISDALLDKFALSGTSDDAISRLATLDGLVDRFEFGTPHGLGERPSAIRYIGETIVKEMER